MAMKRFVLSILALLAMVTGMQAQNTINGHEYVDLGLPSGTLWATCNVGANSPEEFGNYFAWGETQPKDNYNWSTYKYYNGSGYNEADLTKYLDLLTELLPEDDAATANWGSSWFMPHPQQIEELINKTTRTWEKLNGVNGSRFTGSNGNSIFLPAAGYCLDADFTGIGSSGAYWSSSLSSDRLLEAYFFDVDCPEIWRMFRSNGLSVRPVTDFDHVFSHTHSYATTWSWDENTHWHACTSTEGACDAPKADEAAHTFDANNICTVCGYEGLMEYGFSVYNTEVTSQNKNDILGNGVFSYLPETKTLSVRGNHLSPRYGNILVNESVEGLVVNISGDVTLSALTGFLSYSDMTITGPGHLTVSTQMTTTDIMECSTLVIKDITIDAECDQWGIAGEMAETLVIQNSTIKAKGPRGAICDFNGGITLTGCKIVKPIGGYVKNGDVVDASGNLATEVVIAKNGDANLDGVVDIADVVAVLNAMANDSNAPQFNVNGDSAVDIADVVAVLNIMAQQ